MEGRRVTLRDELVRAAVYEACDRPRDEDGRIPVEAVAEIVRVHRVAPLLEHRRAIDTIADWLNEQELLDEASELAWYESISALTGPA